MFGLPVSEVLLLLRPIIIFNGILSSLKSPNSEIKFLYGRNHLHHHVVIPHRIANVNFEVSTGG